MEITLPVKREVRVNQIKGQGPRYRLPWYGARIDNLHPWGLAVGAEATAIRGKPRLSREWATKGS